MGCRVGVSLPGAQAGLGRDLLRGCQVESVEGKRWWKGLSMSEVWVLPP